MGFGALAERHEGTQLNFAVLIPAHNEEGTLGAVIRGLASFHLKHILVVDDCSTDGTAEAARQAGAEVLTLLPGQGGGKGLAMRAGIQKLKPETFDYYVFLDGDGQHDPRDFEGFLSHLAQHPETDFLMGSRFHDRTRIPKARWIVNALGTWALSRIAGQRWEEVQCGFRVVRKKIIDRIDFQAEGFAIETEMALKAAHWKLNWAHIPIRVIYDPQARPSYFRGALDTWLISEYSLHC